MHVVKVRRCKVQFCRLWINERQDFMCNWIRLRRQLTRPPLIKLSSHFVGYLWRKRKMILQRAAANLR